MAAHNQSSSESITPQQQQQPHCLVIPYPAQGHINPMLQFSKRLISKSIRVTLINTRFISKSVSNSTTTSSSSSVHFDTISDGYDEGGHAAAEHTDAYLKTFQKVGSQTLGELVTKLAKTEYPAHCIIYDPFLPWCLDVAKDLGLVAAPFFTQSCAVDTIYYHVYKGLIDPSVTLSTTLIPGLPQLEPDEMPSFISDYGSHPAVFEMIISQFSNIHKADWVLCNTIYELEKEAADWLSTLLPLKTVGPTIPSMYLDKQLQDDRDYGFSIFKPNNQVCINWLNDCNKPKGSVIYVSFGSMASLGPEQMEELAHGLKNSGHYFLWVVRASEEAKLPPNFSIDVEEKGLIVSWCPQLEVLAHEAVGCFVTHCGWNSTLEALSMGVPMVAMPQWTDQPTNAKYIEDVWKMGVRCGKEGIVKREVVEKCLREVMEGEEGKEMKRNAEKWKEMMKEAASEGGSSDTNIAEFANSLRNHQI
ncbi:Flavonol 7-O-beta-glucosyltransferase UGT74F1 [Linum perenne]